MGDIVNLNKFRKGKDRQARKDLAAVNRHKFARPKAELVRLDSERDKADAALDAHRLADEAAAVGRGENNKANSDDRPGTPRDTD